MSSPGNETPAAPAPVNDAPAAASAAPASSAPAAPEAQSPAAPAAETPAAAAPAEGDALKLHTDTPTLLEEAKTDPEAPTPEGAKPAEGEKPAEALKPGEEGAKPAEPAYTFQPYELPENFKAAEEPLKNFNNLLVEPNLSPQERGQKLIDMHIGEVTKLRDQMIRDQHTKFNEMRQGWREQIRGDEELGGSGYQTTLKTVARMRDLFVSQQDMKEFNTFLRTTGAGDHPAFIRLMRNIGKRFDEPSPPPPAFKPPPDIGRKPGGREGRREAMYDHINSQQKRGG